MKKAPDILLLKVFRKLRMDKSKMLSGVPGKQYGLIKPKQTNIAAARAALFADDDDENPVKRTAPVPLTSKPVVDREETDPSLYDYDAWKDKEENQAASHQRKKAYRPEDVKNESKYIGKLLKKAEERKAEREIVFERKLAKERAAEEEEFGPTESFVTSAYKEKLEERKKKEAEDAVKAAEEAKNDVTKKENMGDFYRNFLLNNGRFGRAADEPSSTMNVESATTSTSSSTSQPAKMDATSHLPVIESEATTSDFKHSGTGEDTSSKSARRVTFEPEAKHGDNTESDAERSHSNPASAVQTMQQQQQPIDPIASKITVDQLAAAKEAARERFQQRYGFLPDA